MAITTAPAGTTPESAQPPRPLWQAPLFVMGVSALVYVLCCRPLFDNNPRRLIERDLANARAALVQADGDATYAHKLGERAVAASENFPEYRGQALFLVGYASLHLADKATGQEASDLYREALLSLEQARKAGTHEEDRLRLSFALGKAGLHVGANLPRALEDLEAALDCPEHRVEAYRLVHQGCLQLQPPNYERAIKANEKFRALADDYQITPEEANEARLLAGELFLKMNKPVDALKALQHIPKVASKEILRKARLYQAKAHFMQKDSEQWKLAAEAYAEALADSDLPPADAASALFAQGWCYKRLTQPDDAIKAWTRCLKLAQGPERLAAALALADAHLADTGSGYDRSADNLALAAEAAPPVKKWDNPLVTADEYASEFKRCLGALRTAGRHDLLLKLADASAKVFTPREVLLLKAEASAALAAGHKAAPAVPGSLVKARELFNAAGAAREKAAALPGLKEEEKGEQIYLAAVDYHNAENVNAWAGALLALIELKDASHKRLGEAWFLLAGYYRDTKELEKAGSAYRKCLEYNTPFAYRARYQLAMMALATGKVDPAETILVQNRQMLTSYETDPIARAETLFALSSLVYRRRDYNRARQYLEEVVGKFRADPRFRDTPEMTQARFQLADTYRQIAMQHSLNLHTDTGLTPNIKATFAEQYKIWQEQAAKEFTSLDLYLRTRAGEKHLSPEQRAQVPFIAARCVFNLGRYKEALVVYERLIQQYGDTVEGLDAMGGAVACHAALKEPEKVKQRLLQIKMALPHVPKEARDVWQKWLDLAIKEVERQTAPKKTTT
jgi:hypothetical protein